MSSYNFTIHQLKESTEIDSRGLLFEPYSSVLKNGLSVDWANYDHVYSGNVELGPGSVANTLEHIFCKYNFELPLDFEGHSLSISDIITIDGFPSCYIDINCFVEIPSFQSYRYFSTQRPVDIGTFPQDKSIGLSPSRIVNFDEIKSCCSGKFCAWGFLEYEKPLTEKQISDYELRPSTDNPGSFLLPFPQKWSQVQFVGRSEDNNSLGHQRITCLVGDTGYYALRSPTLSSILQLKFDTYSSLSEPVATGKTLDKSSYASIIESSKPVSDKKPGSARLVLDRP